MTRETKVGLMVATSFLALVGGVLGVKELSGPVAPGSPPTIATSEPPAIPMPPGFGDRSEESTAIPLPPASTVDGDRDFAPPPPPPLDRGTSPASSLNLPPGAPDLPPPAAPPSSSSLPPGLAPLPTEPLKGAEPLPPVAIRTPPPLPVNDDPSKDDDFGPLPPIKEAVRPARHEEDPLPLPGVAPIPTPPPAPMSLPTLPSGPPPLVDLPPPARLHDADLKMPSSSPPPPMIPDLDPPGLNLKPVSGQEAKPAKTDDPPPLIVPPAPPPPPPGVELPKPSATPGLDLPKPMNDPKSDLPPPPGLDLPKPPSTPGLDLPKPPSTPGLDLPKPPSTPVGIDPPPPLPPGLDRDLPPAPPPLPGGTKPAPIPNLPDDPPPLPSGNPPVMPDELPKPTDAPRPPANLSIGQPNPSRRDPTTEPAASLGSRPASVGTPEPRIDSYDEEWYYCRAGDTLEMICQKFYAVSKYEQALRQYNLERNFHPSFRQERPTLGQGQVVKVPPMRILERMYPTAIPGFRGPADAPKSPAGTLTPIGGSDGEPGPVYEVRRDGMTLKDIAREELRDANQWTRIFHLNRYLNPNEVLPVGARINMPRTP